MISILLIVDSDKLYWTPYCLRAIEDNLSGYDNIIIICHQLDFEYISTLPQLSRLKNVTIINMSPAVDNVDRHFLRTAYLVLNSDAFTKAEYICIMLPNYIVTKPFNLLNWITNDNKVCILVDTYAALSQQHGNIYIAVLNWKRSTENIIKKGSIDYEYARLIPIMYPRFVFSKLREYLMNSLQVSNILDYLNSIENNTLPDGFCFDIYNVIGAFLHKFYPDAIEVTILSTATQLYQKIPCIVADFNSVIDDNDVQQAITTLAQNRLYDYGIRNYLKLILDKT